MNTKEKALQVAKEAYTLVPFYMELEEAEKSDITNMQFEDIPIITKEMIGQAQERSLLSSRYIMADLTGKLVKTRTSGTTGKFSEICWDRADNNRSLTALWIYRKKYYGVKPDDKMCFFTLDLPKGKRYLEEKNKLIISRETLCASVIEEAYQKILDFDPVWMILQPSIAILLCECVKKGYGIPDSLSYIEFTGETLTKEVRNRVEQLFGCTTADQYGTKEVNSIAYECPEGKMHCMEANVFLEELENENQELCVTTLQNHAMPYVRFRLGDRGRVIHHVECKCGRKGDVLELYPVRTNDWGILPDGTKVNPYMFLQRMTYINRECDQMLLQYQIIQQETDRFLVRVVVEEEEIQDMVWQMIKKEFGEFLGEKVQIDIHFEHMIQPDQTTGKTLPFINRIPR